MLVEWRDFRRAWRREVLERETQVQRLTDRIADLAQIASECTVSGHPVRKHLQIVVDFVARLRRSQEAGRFDIDDLEAQLIRLSSDIVERHNKGTKTFRHGIRETTSSASWMTSPEN